MSGFVAWAAAPDKPAISVTRPWDGESATAGNGMMVALAVETPEQVHRVYDKALALAERVTDMAPDGISHCFFTNSGSEAADTSLKIALGYHRARGEGNRTRLIGRPVRSGIRW